LRSLLQVLGLRRLLLRDRIVLEWILEVWRIVSVLRLQLL
jgi:hypothetical protein